MNLVKHSVKYIVKHSVKHSVKLKSVFAYLFMCLMACDAAASIVVRDDSGQIVTLPKHARRVISFSPANTELLFAAGGGDRIVGVLKFSDFPEAAQRIPVVGDSRELDMERIITLKPDLLVLWRQGTSAKQIERLKKLGVPIFFSDVDKLVEIPKTIQVLGQLMGTEKTANNVAASLREQLTALSQHYADLSPVRLFYQIWDHPLFTLNGQQIASDAIRLCGGVNIFASQTITAPIVSIEAVLKKNPEVIIGTMEQKSPGESLAMWKRYPTMIAVKRGNLFELDGTVLNRPSPRMIVGITDLCEKLDMARKNRG